MHPGQRAGNSIWKLEKLPVRQEGRFWSAGPEQASKLAQRLQVKANDLPPSNEQSNKSKMISFTVHVVSCCHGVCEWPGVWSTALICIAGKFTMKMQLLRCKCLLKCISILIFDVKKRQLGRFCKISCFGCDRNSVLFYSRAKHILDPSLYRTHQDESLINLLTRLWSQQ